ncbi:hypothetical protein Gotur_012357 [Gossypium turneri]
MAEAAKSISPPNTAYQFEVSWRALSGDRSLQAHLLKVCVSSYFLFLLHLQVLYHRSLKTQCLLPC